jgi:rare lipoprotein A
MGPNDGGGVPFRAIYRLALPVMDGNSTKLRALLAGAVVLGLGGAIAPGYAREAAPMEGAAAPSADLSQPAAPTADNASGLAASGAAVDEGAADEDNGSAWQTVGGGMASWYGAELAGHRTASGERFDPNELTAAHRTLPLGSHVRVTYHGHSVVVRINDRGPFSGHRVIDLSRAAAEQIGLRRAGSGQVTLAVEDDGDGVTAQ